jgi:hypothetical protein
MRGHAFSRDYSVTLVSDGHSTYDTETLKAQDIISHHNEVLGTSFASLKRADEIDFRATSPEHFDTTQGQPK